MTQRTSHPCKYQEQPKNIIVAGWRESDLQVRAAPRCLVVWAVAEQVLWVSSSAVPYME